MASLKCTLTVSCLALSCQLPWAVRNYFVNVLFKQTKYKTFRQWCLARILRIYPNKVQETAHAFCALAPLLNYCTSIRAVESYSAGWRQPVVSRGAIRLGRPQIHEKPTTLPAAMIPPQRTLLHQEMAEGCPA